MNHKRRRPKNKRAGCKPHKVNGVDAPLPVEKRARTDEVEQLAEGELWNVCGSGIYSAGCPACLSGPSHS